MTEASPRPAESMSPAQELTTEITGFMQDFRTFTTDLHAKLQEQDRKMTTLDRKQFQGRRPALSTEAESAAPHQKAFAAYLRTGDDAALRHIALEGKTALTTDGGFPVDPQLADTIRASLSSTSSLRAIANVATVDAGSYDILVDTTEADAGWASETGSQDETAAPVTERISIVLHELSAMPKASQRLLDDSAFDIEGWIAGRIAEKFARSEAQAFVTGDGVDKPKGFLAEPTGPHEIWTWGEIGYIVTGTEGGLNPAAPADALIDLVYALGADYRAGASFVMNSRTAGLIRKIKDNDGRFLWSDGLAAGQPARLLGYPVLIAEDMPEIAASSFPIAFGNFAAGYTIAERPDLRVLRDPFSAKPHVLFYATKRIGGGVTDYAAIKLLKFATS